MSLVFGLVVGNSGFGSGVLGGKGGGMVERARAKALAEARQGRRSSYVSFEMPVCSCGRGSKRHRHCIGKKKDKHLVAKAQKHLFDRSIKMVGKRGLELGGGEKRGGRRPGGGRKTESKSTLGCTLSCLVSVVVSWCTVLVLRPLNYKHMPTKVGRYQHQESKPSADMLGHSLPPHTDLYISSLDVGWCSKSEGLRCDAWCVALGCGLEIPGASTSMFQSSRACVHSTSAAWQVGIVSCRRHLLSPWYVVCQIFA